jgi:UDP-N-acetylmuramoyl-tripeptide--D-alanyl-D-alanine ligase
MFAPLSPAPLVPSLLYDTFCQSSGIVTDTRQMKPRALYVALKGNNFDGNNFAQQAIEAGALCAIVNNSSIIPNIYSPYLQIAIQGQVYAFYTNRQKNPDPSENTLPTFIFVNETLDTLQNLATHHRRQFKDIGVIALTGSNGKTTTKELLKQILQTEYRVHATNGNLNNHIGVPLTLLAMPKNTQIAIIEMGANHQGEIAQLCHIAEPTHGIITNIGKAHLEGFGGEAGVAKGKGEMFDYLEQNNGYAFVNGNDKQVYAKGLSVSHHTLYGNIPDSAVNGVIANTEPYLSVWLHANSKTTHHIDTQLVGAYNLDNVLAGVAVGQYFGIPLQKIMAAIGQYCPNNSRSQRMTWGNNVIIMDAYNANPSSMQVALQNLANLRTANKVAILGEMRELGSQSDTEHKHLIDLLDTIPNLEMAALIGKNYKPFVGNKGYRYFDHVSDAKIWFDRQQFEQATILIKGSRGVTLEKLLENN